VILPWVPPRFKNGSTKLLIIHLAVLAQFFWHIHSLTPFCVLLQSLLHLFPKHLSALKPSARSSSSELQVHFSEIACNPALRLMHPPPAFNHHFHIFTCFEFPLYGLTPGCPLPGGFRSLLLATKKGSFPYCLPMFDSSCFAGLPVLAKVVGLGIALFSFKVRPR
jgi:hypothetical protein